MTSTTTSATRPGPTPRSIPADRLRWLEGELARWQAEGRLGAEAAAGIRGQYTASRRFSASRLLLALGAAFVGVGLLWLVAANLDELSPLTRFTGVVVLWLATTAAAEGAAHRRDGRDAVVGALRLLAAVAFGAVVFQAAQSLQVPAYSSGLLGAWAGGALLYAYAAVGVAPLLVGIVTGVGWYAWAVAERTDDAAGTVIALLLAGVVAAALAVAHRPGRVPEFAPPWRTAGALLALVGLFVAALPGVHEDGLRLTALAWAGVAVALVAAAGAAALADRDGRLEVAAGAGVAVAGLLVLAWQVPAPDDGLLSGSTLLRAVVATVVYLLAAAWFAVLGVLRGTPALTAVATAALVVFTVVQSFAVFEPILSGAALFLALGAVLAGSGWLFDRGRRRLVAEAKEVAA